MTIPPTMDIKSHKERHQRVTLIKCTVVTTIDKKKQHTFASVQRAKTNLPSLSINQ